MPPSTPAVSDGIKRPGNGLSTQVLHRRVGTVHREVWCIRNIRALRLSVLSECDDPVLKGDSCGAVYDAAAGTVEVGVRDVAAVETRRDAEEVRVGLILESGVKVSGVACEAELRQSES